MAVSARVGEGTTRVLVEALSLRPLRYHSHSRSSPKALQLMLKGDSRPPPPPLPCPTYQWYLVSSSSYSIDNVGGALTINTLDASFTGQYSCVATNQIQGQAGALGSVTSSANLSAIGIICAQNFFLCLTILGHL